MGSKKALSVGQGFFVAFDAETEVCFFYNGIKYRLG